MRKSSQSSHLILRHSASSPDIRRAFIQPLERAKEVIVTDSRLLEEAHQHASVNDSATSTSDDYSCNICFDVANDAVLTCCGHLYCWSCLYQWLVLPSQLESPICPVCKSGCDLASLTPIYGRGSNLTADITPASTSGKMQTLSSESQIKPKNLLDQWLVPHLHPPTLPMLPPGETPARPVARRQPVLRRVQKSHILTTPQSPSSSNMFGGTHPVVIFSAGVTTLCGMQILQNGGFGSTDTLENGTNTSKMMWLLAFFIIAGVWFH